MPFKALLCSVVLKLCQEGTTLHMHGLKTWIEGLSVWLVAVRSFGFAVQV